MSPRVEAAGPSRSSGVRRALALARKDLLLEWRSRESLTVMLLFALLVVLLLAVTLGAEPSRAPAVLWVALTLAAVLGIARSASAEVEQDTLERLLLYPGSRESLFWGKWAALVALLTALYALLLLVLGLLFNLDLWSRLPALLGVGALGIAGIAAVGTLFAALFLHVRGRELLMPLLLLPVALPVLLGGARATEAVLAGRSMAPWPGLLSVFAILYLLVSPILFEVVVEEL